MAVQWNQCSVPPPSRTVPQPLPSSKATTTPARSAPPCPRDMSVTVGSVDDLGDRELDDVGGADVLERGDQRVDRVLGDDRLDGEPGAAVELVDRRRLHRRDDVDDLVEGLGADVELDQHAA